MTPDAGENEANARAAAEGPAEPTPVVFIIGAGVVGTALAARLSRAGVPVAGVHGRQTDLSDAAGALSGVLASTGDYPDILSESEAIIVSVRDARIPEVAERLVREKRLRKQQVILHTSGAHAAADVLGPARGKVRGLGTLHPLLSFANPLAAAQRFRGAAFGVEGDAPARATALRLVRAVGGRPVELKAANMALYHAGAVVASNYVVALAEIARSLLVAAGVPAGDALPALLPLLTSAVENLADVGLPAAITGPVVRGDVESVGRHLAALARHAPGAVDIYRRLGRETLRIARKKREKGGGLEPGEIAALEDLFADRAFPRPSAPRSRRTK